jgi:hypothetical protein
VESDTEQKNSTFPFLPWIALKASKELIAITPELDSSHDNISHRYKSFWLNVRFSEE